MNKNFYGEIISRLESQIKSNSLVLTDTYLGDEGASYLANFLKNYTHYISIDLKGNNISAEGFKIVGETLKNMNSLRSLNLEWNYLGSNLSGIVNLREALRKYNTISSLDLKNNQLSSSCVISLCEMLKELSNLKNVDLRWNNIGNEGGKSILSFLKDSKRKIKISLDGNGISEGIIQEIASFESNTNSSFQTIDQDSLYIKRDTLKNDYLDYYLNSQKKNDFAKKTYDLSFVSPHVHLRSEPDTYQIDSKLRVNQMNTPQSFRITNTISNENNIRNTAQKSFIPPLNTEKIEPTNDYIKKLERTIHELEANLNQEKIKHDQIQEKYHILYHEHEIEKKYRQETESKQLVLRDDINKKEFSKQEVEFERERLKKDNAQLREELHNLKTNLEHQNSAFSLKCKETEDKFNQALKELINENAILKNNNDRAILVSDEKINDIKRDYEIKCRQYEEQLKNFYAVNTELSEELKKQTDYIQRLKIDFEENMRKVIQRTREDEQQKTNSTLRSLEQRMNALNENNDQLSRKLNDQVREMQLNERKSKETIFSLENEMIKYKSENERNFEQVLQSNSLLEKTKIELSSKESIVNKLEKQLYNLDLDIQRTRATQNDDNEKFKREYENQKKKFEDFERQTYLRVNDLERNLKESQAEASRYKAEYEKLCAVLQGNLNKAISKTINDHQRSGNKYDFGV